MKKTYRRFVFFIFLFFCYISLNALMLDDMDDNNNQNNWGGYWYTYDDLNSGGDSYVVPWSAARWQAAGQSEQPFFMQGPGRTGEGYAARMTGFVTTTFQYGFVGMGTSFIDPKGPVDLSTCGGIRFWVRGDGRPYRVKITSSHPGFLWGDGDNHYGRVFTSTTSWTQIDILMSNLTQEPWWGHSVNLSDALSMATDIQFQTVGQPHSSIDLRVDEIDIYGCASYPAQETPTPTPTQPQGGSSCLLDDMDDNNNANNWGGYWYTYDDLNSGGDSYVVPWSAARWQAAGQSEQPFFMQGPGRTGEGYAARMTGFVTTTFQYGFVGMGTSFIDPKGPVDLSTCGGIRFWVRGDGRPYRIKITSSHPGFLWGDGDNHYGRVFTSTTDWTQIDILMSNLTQELYWGSSVNLSDAMSMATDIQFQTVGQPHSSINLWVDEIDIYGCASCPGQVTPTLTPTATFTFTSTPTPVCPCPAWFGKKVQGAWPFDFSYFFNACKYRMPEDGVINSIALYIESTNGAEARVALYADNGGTPGNLIVQSASEAISQTGWHTFDIEDTILSAGIYWLAVQTQYGIRLRLDTINVANEVYYYMPYGPFPATGGSGSIGDGAYDMYVNYCPLNCPTPTPVVTPVLSCECPAVMGKQYDGGITPSNINGYISMNWYGMTEPGIAQSISVRVTSGSGNMRVAIYSDISGEPGKLLVESVSSFVSVGWNEIDIEDIVLEQGKVYWLAMQSDSSLIRIGRDTGVMGDERYMVYPYKNFPEIAFLGMVPYSNNWDIRVNYCPFWCPGTPTWTPTDTPTYTWTPTPTYTWTPTDTPTYTPTVPIGPGLLDDMEDNNNQNNWGGYWYTYDDLGNNGSSYVVPWSEARWNTSGLPKPTELFYMQSPGRTDSGYAARMTGYVTTTFQWGFIGMGTSFLDPKGPVNLSTCTGVRFWHKGDGKTYRMKISSSHPNFLLGDGDNHYGRTFTTTTNWQQANILMSSLTQASGWGTTVNRSDALSMATDIQFQTEGQPHTSIDLWIDEIEFYGCASYPGQTPVATNTWTNTPVGPTYTYTPTLPAGPGLLDDMEDNNNQNNWGGYWYTYDDLGSNGSSYVVPWSEARWNASGLPKPTELFYMQSPGRTGSGYAARMTGYVTTIFQYGFIGMGTSFIDPKGPVNLSTCTGVRFWHKGDGRTYRVKISSSHPNFLLGEGDNHYGYAFVTGTNWTQMDILMSSLTQELYWGTSVTRSNALSMATDIQFQTVGQPHTSIDLWIDEIEFYGCASYPGQTPVGTATNTPSGPTNTWTSTPTRTPTRTPTWDGTGTPTPTPGDRFKFDNTKPLITYPNPYSGEMPLAVDFYLMKPAELIYFRLYTLTGRLIREVPYSKYSPLVSNDLLQGKNTIVVKAEHFKGLAHGIYYFVLVAEEYTKKQAKSNIGKIIILK